MQDSIPTRVDEIDWSRWTAVDRATLLFVIQDERILLIRKKRGLGAGKINGPGGRLEPGETPRQAAIREVTEEIGVVPTGVQPGGILRFQFVDGYSIHVWTFTASAYDGTLIETDEAIPMWYGVDQIPYDEMWADDIIWVPELLRGRHFTGRFIFDKDAMLDHRLDLEVPPEEFDGCHE